jgi:hypothetical protein
VLVLCLFCPLYDLCLCFFFLFFVHCMACVCRLSFLSILWPVLLRFKVANYPFGIFELFLTKICFFHSSPPIDTILYDWVCQLLE